MKARITLYDSNGMIQSAGITVVGGKAVSLSDWIFGGEHCLRRPLGAIRRIARDWAADGGDRRYIGHDDVSGIAYEIAPCAGATA